jgi:hypothetical protein
MPCSRNVISLPGQSCLLQFPCGVIANQNNCLVWNSVSGVVVVVIIIIIIIVIVVVVVFTVKGLVTSSNSEFLLKL